MPLQQPIELEYMHRMELAGCIVRLWADVRGGGSLICLQTKLNGLLKNSSLILAGKWESESVLAWLVDHLDPYDCVTAIEVLDEDTLCGYVAYFVWP